MGKTVEFELPDDFESMAKKELELEPRLGGPATRELRLVIGFALARLAVAAGSWDTLDDWFMACLAYWKKSTPL